MVPFQISPRSVECSGSKACIWGAGCKACKGLLFALPHSDDAAHEMFTCMTIAPSSDASTGSYTLAATQPSSCAIRIARRGPGPPSLGLFYPCGLVFDGILLRRRARVFRSTVKTKPSWPFVRQLGILFVTTVTLRLSKTRRKSLDTYYLIVRAATNGLDSDQWW